MKHTSACAVGMISYNTSDYLHFVLNDLQERGIILHWWSILHPAYKDDLTGEDRKEHRHVELLVKAGFDIDDIMKEFWETDPNNTEPLKPQYEDKERHVPLRQQLEHAILYDLHDEVYLRLHDKITDKPYYNLDYNDIQTDCQEWLDNLWLEARADFWKIAKKPSKEEIFFAIFNNCPVVHGDEVLTLQIAMKRRWMDSWTYRNTIGAIRDRGINVDDIRGEIGGTRAAGFLASPKVAGNRASAQGVNDDK